MKNLDKLSKGEIESLIERCNSKLRDINKKEEEKKKLDKRNKPLKTKIKDLAKYDSIYLIKKYPITDDFKHGYAVVKCYVSNIAIHEDDRHLSMSIENDDYPFGSYGMYVTKNYFDCPYFFNGGGVGFSFYTLDIDNWESDLVKAYEYIIERKQRELDIEIHKFKDNVDEHIRDGNIINELLKTESKNK